MDHPTWRGLARWGQTLARPHWSLQDIVLRGLADRDVYLQACAAFAAGRLRLDALRPELLRLSDSATPLVAETCRHAIRQVGVGEIRVAVLTVAHVGSA